MAAISSTHSSSSASSSSSGYFTRHSARRAATSGTEQSPAQTAASTRKAGATPAPSSSSVAAAGSPPPPQPVATTDATSSAASACSLPPAKSLAEMARTSVAAAVPPKKRKRIRVTYENDRGQAGSVVWEPPHWLLQLQNIRKMREKLDAPVDTMGCDVISDKEARPQDYRYQVLLSLMLSSQTKDEVTSAAVARLRAHGCTVDNIMSTPDSVLGQLIYPVSFWKTKVTYIKKTTQMLIDHFDRDVPKTYEELCSLVGVGPKMAHLIMRTAWQQTTGIAVDTHVHRISNRLGWVPKETTKPEDTMAALHSWLPREHWDDVNWLLVGFGQTMCRGVAPKCSECLNKGICPFGQKFMKTLVKKMSRD